MLRATIIVVSSEDACKRIVNLPTYEPVLVLLSNQEEVATKVIALSFHALNLIK